MEPLFAGAWLPPHYKKRQGGVVDYEREDGRIVVDVKLGAQGIRDLHGALMQLALFLAETRDVERACLVIRFPRMTLESARDAWTRAKDLLRPDIANRLAVVLVLPGRQESWFEPKCDPAIAEIAEAIAKVVRGSPAQGRTSISISRKFFEIWKVLLEAWLRRRGPLSARDIAAMAGCSIPTTMQSIDLLMQRGELVGEHRRGEFELQSFPKRTFEQAASLADTFRRTSWFVDVSGRLPEPLVVLRRIQRAKPARIALGGVLAARHWDPRFDLHGTPRLDITYWVPKGELSDLQFISRMDPGLRAARSKDTAVLAVHQLSRAVNLFDESSDDTIPFADPVEVLLDLHELGLHEQLNALVRTMRQEKST